MMETNSTKDKKLENIFVPEICWRIFQVVSQEEHQTDVDYKAYLYIGKIKVHKWLNGIFNNGHANDSNILPLPSMVTRDLPIARMLLLTTRVSKNLSYP